MGFGRTHDRRYAVLGRDLVLSGRARPSAVVTYHGRLDDAPAVYRAFDHVPVESSRPFCGHELTHQGARRRQRTRAGR